MLLLTILGEAGATRAPIDISDSSGRALSNTYGPRALGPSITTLPLVERSCPARAELRRPRAVPGTEKLGVSNEPS